MKKIIVNGKQEYIAEKIIKNGNNIKLIKAKQEIGGEIKELGDLTFPNISNFDDFQLEEGQSWDISEDEEKNQRIIDLELAIAEILGGAV